MRRCGTTRYRHASYNTAHYGTAHKQTNTCGTHGRTLKFIPYQATDGCNCSQQRQAGRGSAGDSLAGACAAKQQQGQGLRGSGTRHTAHGGRRQTGGCSSCSTSRSRAEAAAAKSGARPRHHRSTACQGGSESSSSSSKQQGAPTACQGWSGSGRQQASVTRSGGPPHTFSRPAHRLSRCTLWHVWPPCQQAPLHCL